MKCEKGCTLLPFSSAILTLPFFFAIVRSLPFDLTLPFSRVVRAEDDVEKETVLFYQSDGTAREFVYLFLIKDAPFADSTAGVGFAEPGLPCHQRFISTARGSRAMALREERKSLINFEPRH